MEDMFAMSNMRIFNKEIEKKKGGMFILCYIFGQLSSVNLCYSKMSVVMLLGYRIAGISRKLRVRTAKICPAPKCCILKSVVSYMPGAKNLKHL